MFKAACLFILFTTCHGNEGFDNRAFSPRIVGGSPAIILDIPYQASVQVIYVHKCGGAIISTQWIVTAAQCTKPYTANQLSIRAGSPAVNYGLLYNISLVVNHPSYSPSKMINDISLLKTTTIIKVGIGLWPVNLIRTGLEIPVGTLATVSGWGATTQDGQLSTVQMMKVQVPIVSEELCDAIYGGITDTMICAGYAEGGKDVCQGDYGGPLVVNGELVGIASWGNGCAQANKPSVYTKVSKYRTWIEITAGV